jgi:methionine-rich copper-binding protein CopC
MRPHFPRGRRWAPLLALSLLLLLPGAVTAHAELDVPTPADEAMVDGSPPEVSGTFTQDLVPDSSAMQLRTIDGEVVAEGVPDPADPRRMAITDLPELSAGEYEVRWTTISAEDDEVARGTWTFTVAATPTPTAAPSPTATPSATAAPSVDPSPTPVPTATPAPSPSGDGGTGTSDTTADAILPIIIALALVALVGGFLLTRRNRTTPPA